MNPDLIMKPTESNYITPSVADFSRTVSSDKIHCFVPGDAAKFDSYVIASISETVDGDFLNLPNKKASLASSPLEPWPTHQLLEKLEALRKTPEEERWPDADWPDTQAFEDARAFVRRLPLTSIPLPDIGLADDGEVNFLWKDGGVHVDLGFYGTHTFSYFAQGKDGTKMYGEEARVSEGLPAEIIVLLSA